MLFTRCPGCQTTFRISADTLRVANGAVRCGQCATVFSAFSGLRQDTLDPGLKPSEDFLSPTLQTQELAGIEEIDSPKLGADTSDGDETPADQGEFIVLETTEPADDTADAMAISEQIVPTVEPSSAAPQPSGVTEAPSAKKDTSRATETSPPVADASRTAETTPEASSNKLHFEPPVDEWAQVLKEIEDSGNLADVDPEAPSVEAAEDEPEAPADDDADAIPGFWNIGEPILPDEWSRSDRQTGTGATRPVAASLERRETGDALTAAATAPHVEPELTAPNTEFDEFISDEQIDATLSAEPDPDIIAALESSLSPGLATASRGRRWRIGAALLAVALAAQVTHHYRRTLATQAVIGPLIVGTYGMFGATLSPDWDLGQYEITNWAATAGESEGGVADLRITAQIRNDGPRAQPYPSIQLELKDRWEAVIGSRVFPPSEYLGREVGTDSLMPTGESVPADIAVLDPGLDASGFELDVCLSLADGAVRCAADNVFQ